MQSAAAAELSAALEMPAIARRAAAIGVEASSLSSSSVDNESLIIAFDDDDGSNKDKGRKSGGSDASAAAADPSDIFSKSWVCIACTRAHVSPIFLDQLIHRVLTN